MKKKTIIVVAGLNLLLIWNALVWSFCFLQPQSQFAKVKPPHMVGQVSSAQEVAPAPLPLPAVPAPSPQGKIEAPATPPPPAPGADQRMFDALIERMLRP